jgi:hypothetical protein
VLYSGILPAVWILCEELKDMRELPRIQMALTKQRTAMKNRIQANLVKYGIRVEGCVRVPFHPLKANLFAQSLDMPIER